MYKYLNLEHAISSNNHFFLLEQKLDSRNVFKIFNIEDCLKIEISRYPTRNHKRRRRKSDAQYYLELCSRKQTVSDEYVLCRTRTINQGNGECNCHGNYLKTGFLAKYSLNLLWECLSRNIKIDTQMRLCMSKQ
jgi:hypothetical protein